ncbi:MAG: hypothetical protein J2P21_22025, partial [Chloracidobacterium sp.]|nr:hypothetical protein [Chloracidobacterium sp.]
NGHGIMRVWFKPEGIDARWVPLRKRPQTHIQPEKDNSAPESQPATPLTRPAAPVKTIKTK